MSASVDSDDHQRGGSRRRSVARLSAVQALYQLEANPEIEPDAVVREFARHRFGREIDGDQLGEADPRDVFHHQEERAAGVLGVVGGDDVRVGQAGGGAHLAAEALHRGGPGRVGAADDLQGDGPPQDAVGGTAILAQERTRQAEARCLCAASKRRTVLRTTAGRRGS